jgi:predicted DCC family thiol-disulfide oxidoreductase YuxK
MQRAADSVTGVPYSYRRDPAVPDFPDERPLVIFDGNCVLCSGFAQFLLRRDRRRAFRLLAAQTPTAAALYVHYRLDPKIYETNILLENGRAWFKSEASIRIIERLGFPWRLISIARVLPRPWRDRLYDIIARNRLRWFGVRDTCLLSLPADADRFLT